MKQLSTLLLIIILSIRAFGQQETMPKACTNPGNGILVGGSFSISTEYGCTDAQNPNATFRVFNAISPNGEELINPVYIYDLKDGQDITRFPPPQTSTTVSKPGTYWIMQGGNEKGQAYIACKAVEVIQTEMPDVKVSSCGEKSVTVTFLNTPRNKKHGKYRVVWGDGSQDFVIPSQASFPFDMSHTYINPPAAGPAIVSIYTRGNKNEIEVCNSNPYGINSVAKPVINELEGLNAGESVKLTVSAGLDGQEYNIQKKTDNGNWTNTGKKIIRNSGISSATQTIDGLSRDSLYCFRLQLKDACNNEILSDEVCTIKLNTTFLSANETRLDWNIPSTNLSRYLIDYSDYPTGVNRNNIFTTSTSQMLDFLDCKKKYNFQITAFIGTTPSSQVRIKSPQIIIDPSSIKEFPAPDYISTVSVEDLNKVKYSILEPGSLKEKYLFYRSVNGGAFEKVGESKFNFYVDENVDLNKNQYCYSFKYEDECGIQSALSTTNACNLKLSIQKTFLSWTPFSLNTNPSNKADYIIESIEGNYNVTIDVTQDTTIDVKTTINYILLNNPEFKPKFIVRGTIKQNISINGTLISFPFTVYSNAVIYNQADGFNTYPNPSEDFIGFDLYSQIETVEIINLQGKIIENQTIENGQVSVKHLPKGKYILRLYGNDRKLISSKVIIKN